ALAQAVLRDVRNDSRYLPEGRLGEGRIVTAGTDLAAQRRFAGKPQAGGGFADHADGRASGVVARREEAALAEGNVHDAKIVRSNHVAVRGDLFFTGSGTAFYFERRAIEILRKRDHGGERRTAYTGKGGDAGKQAIGEVHGDG